MAVIEVRNLHKDFGKLSVLKDISLEVERGEVFGFLGPNGAGKTTTIRCLLGLLRPTSGEALVFGETLENRLDLRRRVGVLLEHDALYKRMSAYANIEYYGRLYGVEDLDAKIIRLLEFVGLADRMNEPIGRFSTGMRRKLGVARALVHNPEILFLDEPTSGLDPEAQHMMRDLIVDLASERQITVFLNSHNLHEVQRICSKIAILRSGVIQAYDTVAHLRNGAIPKLCITLSTPDDATRAGALLGACDSVGTAEVAGLDVTVTLNGFPAPQVIAMLVHDGICIEEVRRVVRSLEDVYLQSAGTAAGAVAAGEAK